MIRSTGERVRPVRPNRERRSEGSLLGGDVRTGLMLPESLRRPFRIVAFDWDGTAVVSRQEDAASVQERLEHLLALGVRIVVITGTNFQNVDRQLSAAIRGHHKRHLYVCTNRGSEVYGFDAESRPIVLWRRVATPEENQRLTEITDAVRQTIVTRHGLEVRVVYNRLNRRKIDLIPLPEWENPPKSAIGGLMQAVEARLRGAGLAGGLREAVELTVRMAREKGLPDGRITTDGKYVEVGLTDKGDSIDWTMRELAGPAGISPQDILVGGDEFGPIDGFPGSDYLMVTPAAKGAVFVSVGPEPHGVPPGVIHLGCGPDCFRALLSEQIRAHEKAKEPLLPDAGRQEASSALAPPASDTSTPGPSGDVGWTLVEDGFNPAREHEIESVFTIANGYLGTRGALPEGTPFSRPATFIAGVFSSGASPGLWASSPIPELAIAPDWARLRVLVEGGELRLGNGKTLEHKRVLDLRRGMFRREWRQRDPAGRVTRLSYLRFASLADRHALVESLTLSPENYSGRVVVEAAIDGRLALAGAAGGPEGPGTAPSAITEAVEETPVLVVQPPGSTVEQAFAMRSLLRAVEGPTSDLMASRVRVKEEGWLGERWEWDAEIGRSYRIDKVVAAYTSRDSPEPAREAAEHLSSLVALGVEGLLAAHEQAWLARWETADVQIAGDADSQVALRFAAYHLIAAANPDDPRVSVGARNLTGEAYKGHVFWDTEIYMLPFYVYTYPSAARALLTYRYATLPGARRNARNRGYRGALYAWESADTGLETTPRFAVGLQGEIVPILTGEQAHHISADVAYAVWQYWRATGDDAFLREAGAEILVETARFWASRVSRGEDGLYHILKVIGPDEYHEGVDDNAYTNGLARWNLERGAEVVELLREHWPERWARLAEALELEPRESEGWLSVARDIYTGFDTATGLIEQFRGYFGLEEIDLAAYEPRTATVDVLLGHARVARSKIIKQADVVLLLCLLWDRFPPEVREVNFRYYEPRCAHGSSLSPSVHALFAARLGDLPMAERYLRQSAEIDLADNMGNAALGIHMAAQGGLWQAAVFGFAGLSSQNDGVVFDPRLLPAWRSLRFTVQWRGRRLCISAQGEPPVAEAALLGGDPLRVAVGRAPERQVQQGEVYRARRADGVWQAEVAKKGGDRWT